MNAESDERIITNIHRRWEDAFARRDLDKLSALYAGQTAFWGSTNDLHKDPDGVRQYFIKLSPNFKRAIYERPLVTRLADNVLASATFVRFVKEIDGKDIELPYRMTHIVIREDGQWKIATHHASPQIKQ